MKYCLGLWMAVFFALLAPMKAWALEVTDVTGRQVSLDAPAKRVILGEGRNVIALSLLTPQPSDVLVGWGSDFKRYKNIYRRFTEALPNLDTVPTVGSGQGASDLSVEKIISLRPDVVILSRSQTPPSENSLLERQLKAAGIKLVYVDFATDPAHDTLKSLQIMAKLIGRETAYERFATFYRAKRREVEALAEKIDPSTQKPLVFLEAHAAGMHACCYSPGDGSFQGFIDLVGGENLGGRTLKGKSGLLTPEYILASQPDIYIATGGSYLEGTPGMVLGPFEPVDKARASLKRVTSRDAIAQLTAVKQHRVHGLYHHLINTPYNIVVLELLAKWIHPDVFGALDPEATLDAINQKFAAVPLTGSLWIDDSNDTGA